MSQRGRRMPSIVVLFAMIGALLLVPLASVSAVQWADADDRYQSAVHIQDQAQRLAILIRLPAALNEELLSASWEVGETTIMSDIPPVVMGLFGANSAYTLETDRLTVDELLGELGDVAIADRVAAVRAQVDARDLTLFEIGPAYDDVIYDAEVLLSQELARLGASATAAGDSDVSQAAEVARATGDLRVAAAGLGPNWAQLATASILDPALADIAEFGRDVAVLEDRMQEVDIATRAASTLSGEWQTLRDDPGTEQLLATYAETIDDFIVGELATSAEGSQTLDLARLDLAEMLALGSRLSEVLDLADGFDSGLAALVDASLDDLDASAQQVVTDASEARSRTLLWLIGAAVLAAWAVLAIVVLVALPIRRMGEAARRISQGDVGDRLPETGPFEIRVGTRALNDALAAMHTAEQQALALAEERLHDPVLQHSMPGALGASLDAAVSRLTRSLAEREEFQKRLAHEASHDGLTKLANRTAVLRRLDGALARTTRSESHLALLFIDIDDFKTINDAHGHHVGDNVLRTIAKRVLSSTREGDVAGRLGGDEFVVVAEGVGGVDEAVALAERVIETIAAPVTFDGLTFVPSASVGIAMADDDSTGDELLRDADLAIYRAKSLGKRRVAVCDEDMRREIVARTRLETAIRTGIANKEFCLYFQPVVGADTRSVISYEALVRWDHPTHGLIPPDRFIPIAERSDLIIDIDRYVLRRAVEQLADWKAHPGLWSARIAVNLSVRNLSSPDLVPYIQSLVQRFGIHPSQLAVEVTETGLLDDLTVAANVLGALRELGIRIALDDFGTGYMSLAHLRALPFDILKIDRTFVDDSLGENHPLIQLIVDTGHLLDVQVVAEGVETEEQADAIARLGADALQGFVFGRPVSAERIEGANTFRAAS